MLRKIRIAVSLVTISILTLYILDFAGIMPSWFGVMAELQFIPALLSLNLVILISLLLATFVFGRIYCSSICPLGIYQDIITRLSRIVHKKKRFRFRKALTVMRWSFVAATVIAFLGGFTVLVGLLDPYSIYSRFAVHILKPPYQAGNNLAEMIFTHFDNHTFYKVSIYLLSIFTLIITILTTAFVGYLAWVNGRIYCNSVCPVGTVLGTISRASLFKIRIDENTCNSCGSCARNCKASCINSKEHKIDYSRCINCFDCLEVCSKNAMKFSYSFHIPLKNRKKVVNASRRRFMMAVGVSSVAATKLLAEKLPLTETSPVGRKSPITPPGSQSVEHLLQKCTSCHLCVSKCPSGIIKPSFLEYGIGGMFQPTLTFNNDFCNYDCTICSDVCPTGALLPLSKDAKHTNQMGQVRFVMNDCIVFTDETSCGACSEHCPTQAVHMVDYKNDLTIPETDTSICVGCGGCEYICPATPNKAIFVEGIKQHKTIKLKKEKSEEVKVDDFGF